MNKKQSIINYLSQSNYILLNKNLVSQFGAIKGIILSFFIDDYFNHKKIEFSIETLHELGIENKLLYKALQELVTDNYLSLSNNKYQLSKELI